MTKIAKEFFEKVKSLPDAVQVRFIERWLHDLEGGDGAINEPELEQKGTVTYKDIEYLVGSIKGGPDDMSYNPKYMQGFGE